MLKTPIIIINFKTYKQSTGKNADILADICDRVARESGKNIAIAVQELDLYRISKKFSIPVLSEHMDPIDYGAHTGHILPQALKDNGAAGCILNHSEDRFDLEKIENSIERANETKLIEVVCANNARTARAIASFHPDFIAVEPPELIGGDISVSTAKPEIIKDTVDKVRQVDPNIKVLCGAGVNTKEDISKALELGAKGVLLASGVVKAKDPEKVLRELVKAL